MEPTPNPYFSVFFGCSVVDPQDSEEQSNHRGLRELRESIHLNGGCVGRLGRRNAIFGDLKRNLGRVVGSQGGFMVKSFGVGAPDFFQRPIGGLVFGMQDDQDAGWDRVNDPVLASPLPLGVQYRQSSRKTWGDSAFQKGLPVVVGHPPEIEFRPNPRDQPGRSVGRWGVGVGPSIPNVDMDAAREETGSDHGTSKWHCPMEMNQVKETHKGVNPIPFRASHVG